MQFWPFFWILASFELAKNPYLVAKSGAKLSQDRLNLS